MIRSLKFWFQRRVRGWDDSETWALDYNIAKYILPRLKKYKELNNGTPYDLTDKEWDNILDKMITCFTFLSSEDRYYNSIPKEVEEGRELFHKYYYDLWW